MFSCSKRIRQSESIATILVFLLLTVGLPACGSVSTPLLRAINFVARAQECDTRQGALWRLAGTSEGGFGWGGGGSPMSNSPARGSCDPFLVIEEELLPRGEMSIFFPPRPRLHAPLDPFLSTRSWDLDHCSTSDSSGHIGLTRPTTPMKMHRIFKFHVPQSLAHTDDNLSLACTAHNPASDPP